MISSERQDGDAQCDDGGGVVECLCKQHCKYYAPHYATRLSDGKQYYLLKIYLFLVVKLEHMQ